MFNAIVICLGLLVAIALVCCFFALHSVQQKLVELKGFKYDRLLFPVLSKEYDKTRIICMKQIKMLSNASKRAYEVGNTDELCKLSNTLTELIKVIN